MPRSVLYFSRSLTSLAPAKQPVRHGFLAAGRDRDRLLKVISVIVLLFVAEHHAVEGLRLVRDQHRRPILGRHANPPALGRGVDVLGVLRGRIEVLERRRIGDFFQPVGAEDADQPFMQHRIAQGLGLGELGHLPPGPERHGLAGFVLHLVGDAEHIVIVDGDRAPENQARAVVVAQHHRMGRRQRSCPFLLPQRVLSGQLHPRLIGPPACVGEIGMRAA